MILLAFLFPLALYLLILGTINRRSTPLLVYGPWDFAGVLFAASGFLLCSGPFALSVFNEPWRDSLLLGIKPADASATESLWWWGLLLLSVYFIVVVAAASLLMWQARKYSSIYNADGETIHAALERVFHHFGLRPLHSGDAYYFGQTDSSRAFEPKALENQGIQTAASLQVEPALSSLLARQKAILEVDVFRAMCHVTLHWDPAASVLRREIERQLRRELAETPSPSNALGGWLTVASSGLFFLTFFIGFCVLIYRIMNRIL